jgi:hypothetical protein
MRVKSALRPNMNRSNWIIVAVFLLAVVFVGFMVFIN